MGSNCVYVTLVTESETHFDTFLYYSATLSVHQDYSVTISGVSLSLHVQSSVEIQLYILPLEQFIRVGGEQRVSVLTHAVLSGYHARNTAHIGDIYADVAYGILNSFMIYILCFRSVLIRSIWTYLFWLLQDCKQSMKTLTPIADFSHF